MINLKNYGTASETAEAIGKPRTTIISAAARGEIEVKETYGGTQLFSIASAKKWCKQVRKLGRPKK